MRVTNDRPRHHRELAEAGRPGIATGAPIKRGVLSAAWRRSRQSNAAVPGLRSLRAPRKWQGRWSGIAAPEICGHTSGHMQLLAYALRRRFRKSKGRDMRRCSRVLQQ